MSGPLLITGASGYLGRHLLSQASQPGGNSWDRVVGVANSNPLPPGVEPLRLDLSAEDALEAALDALAPQAIIHAAAVTPASPQVADSQMVWAVNVRASATLARWAARHGARLVHVSSDAVFGGRETPYVEHDVPAPITPYGASKAAAEAVVAALDPAAVLVRTSLIYGADPPDPNTRLAFDLLNGQRAGHLFTDEIRCPIAGADLARALLELTTHPVAGVLHVAGPEALSRYEFGLALVRWAGGDPASLPAGTTAASGIRRPSQIKLDSSRAQTLLTTRLRSLAEVTVQEAHPWNAHRKPSLS